MTAAVEQVASVTPICRARGAARSLRSAAVRLSVAADRLLGLGAASELSAQDALGGILGALINALPAGVESITSERVAALAERVADGLGAPLAPAVTRRPRRPR